jgi:hypothetical protein
MRKVLTLLSTSILITYFLAMSGCYLWFFTILFPWTGQPACQQTTTIDMEWPAFNSPVQSYQNHYSGSTPGSSDGYYP